MIEPYGSSGPSRPSSPGDQAQPAGPLARGSLRGLRSRSGSSSSSRRTRASALAAAIVFAASVATMFGASALYHCLNWPEQQRRWLRRIDHFGVYGLIAGTYTPIGLLVLDGHWRTVVLGIVWGGALAAILLKFIWLDAPKWLCGRDRDRARLGRRRRLSAAPRRDRPRRLAPRPRSEASPTRPARSSTRSGARTRTRPSSATTRSSTSS